MTVMAGHSTCRIQDIVDDLAITVGGASKLVDRIEQAGDHERQPNPRDRRSSRLALTAAGEAVLTKARGRLRAELRRRLDTDLANDEIAALTRTLIALRAPGHRLSPEAVAPDILRSV